MTVKKNVQKYFYENVKKEILLYISQWSSGKQLKFFLAIYI